MKLTIKSRLYILALVPLLFIAAGMMFFTRAELQSLNHSNIESAREMMMANKQAELKSYLEIVDTILITLEEKNASLAEVVNELAKVKFAGNGYIYGYHTDGTRVLLGQSGGKKLLGSKRC
jgi:methyl-accepting chemotaxis protein